MPRRVGVGLTPDERARLLVLKGTVQNFPSESVQKSPPEFWPYVALGLLRYIETHAHRGRRGRDAAMSLHAWVGRFADLATHRGAKVAGPIFAEYAPRLPLPRRRAWCCPPLVLLRQWDLLHLWLEGCVQKVPQPRNRDRAFTAFQDIIQALLTALDRDLGNSEHTHGAAPPGKKTLEKWYPEFWPRKPSTPPPQEARLLTALLAHYHGVSYDVMRRRVSASRTIKTRALRACSDSTRLLDPAACEALLSL